MQSETNVMQSETRFCQHAERNILLSFFRSYFEIGEKE